jgi:uncharacterized protein
MPRPHICRRIGVRPRCARFKPAGIPARNLDTVRLGLDEVEALRLGDLLGLYQAEAAEEMGVSRPTFGRLIGEARRKVADALLNGKSLHFEGGVVTMIRERTFVCHDCGHEMTAPCGTPRPEVCAVCGKASLHRAGHERGHACHGNKGRERHHHECCHGQGTEPAV